MCLLRILERKILLLWLWWDVLIHDALAARCAARDYWRKWRTVIAISWRFASPIWANEKRVTGCPHREKKTFFAIQSCIWLAVVITTLHSETDDVWTAGSVKNDSVTAIELTLSDVASSLGSRHAVSQQAPSHHWGLQIRLWLHLGTVSSLNLNISI